MFVARARVPAHQRPGRAEAARWPCTVLAVAQLLDECRWSVRPHSPILASTPGADIVEIGEHGYRRTTWRALKLVDHWRRYLDHPDAYLRHLITDEEQRHAAR